MCVYISAQQIWTGQLICAVESLENYSICENLRLDVNTKRFWEPLDWYKNYVCMYVCVRWRMRDGWKSIWLQINISKRSQASWRSISHANLQLTPPSNGNTASTAFNIFAVRWIPFWQHFRVSVDISIPQRVRQKSVSWIAFYITAQILANEEKQCFIYFLYFSVRRQKASWRLTRICSSLVPPLAERTKHSALAYPAKNSTIVSGI